MKKFPNSRKVASLVLTISFILVAGVFAADRGTINSGETKIGINLVSPSYMDTWTFEGNAGDRVIINAVTTSGSLDTTITLYPPDGGPAEATTAGCPAMNCHGGDQLNWQLLQSGLYTIVISDYSLSNSGTYNINLLKIPGEVSSPQDPNGGPIISGETLSGTINVASDLDAFQFYGDVNDRIIINAVTTSGSLDTTITLYPPDSGPAEATTAGCPAMNCHGGDQMNHQLAKSGLYTIVISDYSLNNSGSYNISFLKIPGAVSSQADTDGGPIASGETLNGIINVASDMDAFQFYGTANRRIIVTAVTTSGSLDTTITLYPPDGGSAEATTAGCPAMNCHGGDQMDHQLAQSGLYTIVISDYSLGQVGIYNISFLYLPFGPVSSPEDLDGGPIASGESLGGTINVASDIDAFQVYGNANDRVIINAVTTSGNLDTTITLYPPDGGPAEATTAGCPAMNCHGGDQMDWQLLQSGLYTIVISDYSLTQTGTYNVSLTKIPSAVRPGLYNPSPPVGSATSGCYSELSWDVVADATGYDVYFRTDVTQPTIMIANNISGTSVAIPQVQGDQICQWAVVAHTPTGDIFGPIWWYTTLPCPQTGGLQVMLGPAGAVAAGAQWNVDGGAWQNSEDTVSDLSVGSHTVNYKTITGWTAPSGEQTAISSGQTAMISRDYTQQIQTGGLQVTLGPAGAVSAGAQWNVNGGAWQDSEVTVTGLSVGSHTVNYKSVTGWIAPLNEQVTVNDGQTTSISRDYTQLPAANGKIALLVQSQVLDADEDAIRDFLNANGFDYSIVDATAIKNNAVNLSDYSVLYMRTTSEPSGYNDADIITKILTRVENGGRLIIEYYGLYLASYLGFGDVSIGSWYPVVLDGAYFVEPISSSYVFNNISSWSPPLSPDDSNQLIVQLNQTGSYSSPDLHFNVTPVVNEYWWLKTSYGWFGNPTNSDYCVSHPGLCTSQRTVYKSTGHNGIADHGIESVEVGQGSIYKIGLPIAEGTPADKLTFGPVADQIRKNIINMQPSQQICSNPSIIFSENFDSYPDGADLSGGGYDGWVGRWEGNITASSEESVSSPHSARMDNDSSCWESQLYHPLPYYPVIWFSADIMGIATGRTGCHDFDVLIQLYTDEGGTWGSNLAGVVLKSGTGQSWEEGLVAFTSECSGGQPHSVTLEPDYQGIVGRWINVMVRLDADNNQADIWVDGVHRATLSLDPACPLYKGIAIDCGEGRGYVDNIQVFTCSGTTQTGNLQVTLGPSGAISAGAQWNVDGGAWQDSGATVSGLSVGSHTVNYKTITGWTAPVSEQVAISAGQTTIINRNYIQQSCGDHTDRITNGYMAGSIARILIDVQPDVGTQAYAVEDMPPLGWTVSDISAGGTWDSVNKKVKWGPFLDSNPRVLGYSITAPPDATGCYPVSGTASFDGVDEGICGDIEICEGMTHPADYPNTEWSIVIGEVTAYGAAWKTGADWLLPPNPIPISYVTNAGYLWKVGECYTWDSQTTPPLCWVPCAITTSKSAAKQTASKDVAKSASVARTFTPDTYTDGTPVEVSIAVQPASTTQVYAVEDAPPANWTVDVNSINENGTWDGINKKVKWGPFFDNTARTFTYDATPPSSESGTKIFNCTVSEDGVDTPVTAQIENSSPGQIVKFGSFDGQKNVKRTLKDCNGNDVIFSLSGPGYGEIDCQDCAFSNITLYDTTEKSILSIKTKKNVGTSVGDIICNGPLKGINAKNVDILGNIEIGSSTNPKAAVMITFDQANNLEINSQMPIKSISATEWLGGSINAPSVGSITIKGDKKRGIMGDLVEVDLILSQKPDVKKLALGKLTAKCWIKLTRILSEGNIGTVTAGAIIDSSCFAGVTDTNDSDADGVLDLPDAEASNFDESAMIKKITIKGLKTEDPPYYINSNIAAAQILSVSLSYPENDNNDVPFGLSAGFIKALKVKDAEGTVSFKNLDKPSDSLTFEDAEIRLY